MTPQSVLDSLKRANPVCVICHGTSKHPPIVGDGPPRCYPCVLRLVRLSTEGHVHEWVDGWQKAEPSYRWTETQQWPDDIPMRACLICGPENHKGWMAVG